MTGKLHLSALEAIPDPPSLTQLRKLVQAMLPRVGLPEVILEVMSWVPGFVAGVHLGLRRSHPA